MPGIKHLYKQYGDLKNDLVERIQLIRRELCLNHQLIKHGEAFEPGEQAFQDYYALIKKQMAELRQIIHAHESGWEESNLGEDYAQFNADSLALEHSIQHMSRLPDLETESENFEKNLNAFDALVDKLSENANPKEIMQALDQASKLLADIHQNIEMTRENPLVRLAECYAEGTQVAAQLSNPGHRQKP